MKFNKKLLIFLVVLIIQFFFANNTYAFWLVLPDSPPTPLLPYIIEEDHYGGPAAIQMIQNSQPNIFYRSFFAQSDIYSTILMYNTESTVWFSDPASIRDTLEDPVYSPAPGVNWVDYSNTNKTTVLNKMLYYMNTRKYLTPASIGSGEHWVTVIGYQTDVMPSSSYSSVTLHNVLFYDPLPGNTSICMVTGSAWVSLSDYWGVPYSNPASSWNNKYISVIEPPEYKFEIKVKEWILKGKILLPKEIREYYGKWYDEMLRSEVLNKAFKGFKNKPDIGEPVLIDASNYSYYFVPFKDQHLAAVINAYTGEVEEIREYNRKIDYILEKEKSIEYLTKNLEMNKLKLQKVYDMKLIYDPKLSEVGRLSPLWSCHVIVAEDCNCKDYELYLVMNCEGKLIRGLEGLNEYREAKQ